MPVGKHGGPGLRIERPDVKPCPSCLPGEPGLYVGSLYHCTCANCNGLGVVFADGSPVPGEQANDLLARLVIAQRRSICALQAQVRELLQYKPDPRTIGRD